MKPISIRFTPELYKAIVKKSKELGGLTLSDTVRFLLHSALDGNEKKVKNKQFQYVTAAYYLLNDFILSLDKGGEKINQKAHEKAEKVVSELLK